VDSFWEPWSKTGGKRAQALTLEAGDSKDQSLWRNTEETVGVQGNAGYRGPVKPEVLTFPRFLNMFTSKRCTFCTYRKQICLDLTGRDILENDKIMP
jgi:hypothetical protein